MKRVLRFVFFFFGILVVLAVASLVGLYLTASSGLPDTGELAARDFSRITLEAMRDDPQLRRLFPDTTLFLPKEAVPEHLSRAFLAAEDSSFYERERPSFVSAMQRLWRRLTASGVIFDCGSSISGQVARTILPAGRNYERQMKLAVLTFQLERDLDRTDLLYIHLHQVYLGNHAYGVEEGAFAYFGKSADELSLAESAILASLSSAPSRVNPYTFPERAKERQVYVLGRMLRLGWIGKEEYDAAVGQALLYENALARQN